MSVCVTANERARKFRRLFTAQYKQRVIERAQSSGEETAARKFGIDVRLISRWLQTAGSWHPRVNNACVTRNRVKSTSWQSQCARKRMRHLRRATWRRSFQKRATTSSDDELDFELAGCRCSQVCSIDGGCECLQRYGANYDENGRLNMEAMESGQMVIECGLDCACCAHVRRCANRIVQYASKHEHELEVFDTESVAKRNGLRCRVAIERGDFVAEYNGELISAEQACRRIAEHVDSPNYILIVSEHFAAIGRRVTTICDARSAQCHARYINHSCEPNLVLVPVRVDSFRYPRLAFFATRCIPAMEELTFDYASVQLQSEACSTTLTTVELGERPCECGSTCCRGFLPFERAALR